MKVNLKIKNKNTIIFLISIGISTFMWLLIKLSKDYKVIVGLPVSYINMPKSLIVNKHADSIIQLRLSDNGFDLLSNIVTSPLRSITLDLNTFKQQKISATKTKYYVLSYSLEKRLKKAFNSPTEIDKLKPDSLVMVFEKLKSKKVVIRHNIKTDLAPQYQFSDSISLSPDSIIVFGSKDDIFNINEIYTEEKDFKSINNNIHTTLNLVFPKNISSQESTVELEIDVEKYTEASLDIPIHTDFDQEKNVKIFPKYINIKYAVSLDNYSKIKADSFLVLGTQDTLVSGRLEITLIQQPKHIRILDYSPKMAEFILLK